MHNDRLEALLQAAAADERRETWIRSASRGLEARVLQRLARPESWSEALFSLASWRPLAVAVVVVLAAGAWSGRSITDVFNDDWLTSQTAEEPGTSVDDLEF